MGQDKNHNKNLPKIETFIAKNTFFAGDIDAGEGTIRIDGRVTGKFIKSQGIIIGETGNVTSNIEANILIISGEVTGDIKCLQKLEVLNTSKITGNIEAPLISLTEGATFEGTCKMTKKTKMPAKNEKKLAHEITKLKETMQTGVTS
ncbi:MAG: polymer-forming cytoskeletal protein [Bacteroidetes bacterium]|nr:polymer-forming cytoskeletal protein [Bacteroidota bacterium]